MGRNGTAVSTARARLPTAASTQSSAQSNKLGERRTDIAGELEHVQRRTERRDATRRPASPAA